MSPRFLIWNQKTALAVLSLVFLRAFEPATGHSATSPSVEVRLQAISLVKTAVFAPGADESMVPTSGLDLLIGVRTTDGRRIGAIGEVEISRAIDNTGTSLSLGEKSVRTSIGRGEHVVSRVERVIKTETRSDRPAVGGKEAAAGAVASVGLPGEPHETSASVIVHLGLPAPQAKSLREVAGTIALTLGAARTYTFKNIVAHVGDTFDLGAPKIAAVEVRSFGDGRVMLGGSGDTSRLGDISFSDSKGRRIAPASISRSQSTTNGVGEMELKADLGDVTGPVDLTVTLFGSTESVDAPFVFQNVALP